MDVVKVIVLCGFVVVNAHMDWRIPNNRALDQSLYEEALNPVLCDEQIRFVIADTLLALQFIDAGIRIPRGVLQGNTIDLGNYHQCLAISRRMDTSTIHGKFCMIRLPLSNFAIPDPSGSSQIYFDLNKLIFSNDTVKALEAFNVMAVGARAMTGDVDDRLLPGNPLSSLTFNLAVCIPKPCSTEQALTSALFNLTSIGLDYAEDFCRLPDDKPWSGADYAMTAVLAAFGLLTFISTSYDLFYTFIDKHGSSKSNPMGKIFSVYTNGRLLMTFSSGPDSIDCIDGIRAIAMLWVLIGHAFTSVPFWVNPFVAFQWIPTPNALWITTAHITVDTFFTLSGLLVVYTTAGKLNGKQLMKNLHLFYLNRLLRMFPLLALAALYEASFFNHVTDGPMWNTVARYVETCRSFWWSTLLHIQNYANPETTCIGQTWYLAIDVQLHILSPTILFFVLSGRKALAWIALAVGNIAILAAATVYNFKKEFPSGMMSPNRGHQIMYYLVYYYVNTLTRAAPFLVGMIFGYILHLYRDTKMKWSKILVISTWAVFLGLKSFVFYATYVTMQPDWDNQVVDSLFNSFIRPIWAIGLGLMIITCHHGYGGPLNWMFTWRVWKLPARISYAIYLFHFALMINVNYAAIAPAYFSIDAIVFNFMGHFVVTMLVSFLVTLIVDTPFSIIFKMLLLKSKTKQPTSDEGSEITEVDGKQM